MWGILTVEHGTSNLGSLHSSWREGGSFRDLSRAPLWKTIPPTEGHMLQITQVLSARLPPRCPCWRRRWWYCLQPPPLTPCFFPLKLVSGCSKTSSGNKGSTPEDGKLGYGRHQLRRGKQQQFMLHGQCGCRCLATARHGDCKLPVTFSQQDHPHHQCKWVQPVQNETLPASQPTAWLLTCLLPQESHFATTLAWLLQGSREGGLKQTHAETPRPEQQQKPCPVRAERLPQPPLGKWGGGVFSCFASSNPVHIGPRLQALLCESISGLNVIRQGQNPQVSLSSGYNGSVEKSLVPAGHDTAPQGGGRPGSAVGTQAPAARHLPPFGTGGHCCFPLTSCLRSPNRKRNG